MIHDFETFCNEDYYGGERIADANPAIAQRLVAARQMVASGKDQEHIRKTTGWFTGKFDKKWRYELAERIDLDKVGFKENFSGAGIFYGLCDLEEMLIDPLFFKAYPDWKNAMVRLEYGEGVEEQGSYTPGTPGTNQYYGTTPEIMAHAPTKELMLEVLVHEIQHAVQEAEGFEEGDSPWNHLHHYDPVTGIAGKRTPEEAIKRYLAAPGEVEARDVANRFKLSPEERKAKKPYTSEDNI